MTTSVRQEAAGNSKKTKAISFVGFTLCALLFALCTPTWAQQPGKIFRIGFLDESSAAGMAVLVDTTYQALLFRNFLV
ncbi:MAG: hypothetical protein ACM3TN_18760 [Alphaproteobacteria bacterium]